MTSAADEGARLRQLRWRCRRGMRELDVLLMGYMDNEYTAAGQSMKRAFEQLLTMQDPDIQALLAGRLPAEDAALDELVQRLLDHPDPAL